MTLLLAERANDSANWSLALVICTGIICWTICKWIEHRRDND